MSARRGAALGGTAKEGDNDRAEKHKTEDIKTVVEGHERRAAPDGGIKGGDGLPTGSVGVALTELARLLRSPAGVSVTAARKATFFPLHGDPRFEALLADPVNRAPLPWNAGPEQPEPMPQLVTATAPAI